MTFKDYFSSRNRWLGLVFGIYLILIFIFAGIYYSLYSWNQKSFSFNSDITSTRQEDIKSVAHHDVDKLTRELSALKELHEYLNNRTEPMKVEADGAWDKVELRTSHFQFWFELSPDWTTTEAKHLLKRNRLTIFDETNHLFLSEDILIQGPQDETPNSRPKEIQDWIDSMVAPTEVEVYKKMLTPIIDEVNRRLEGNQNYLVSISQNEPQKIWSFWDFFYFSAITQATVGFGDMLPNSTVVRSFVVIQVLFGLLMLGVLINIVVGKESNKS